MDYIDHPELHEPGAQDFIKVLDEIPDPSISWGVEEEEDAEKSEAFSVSRCQQRRLFLAYNYARMNGEDVSAIEDRILRLNFGLVVHSVTKYIGRHSPDYDDLVAEGAISMLKSIRNFNIQHGYLFSTYAAKSMWYMCVSYWRRNAKHRLRHQKFLQQLTPDRHISDAEYTENSEWIQNQLSLNDVENVIYRMRIVSPDPTTLERLADMLSMSKEGVRYTEKRIIRQIRELFE